MHTERPAPPAPRAPAALVASAMAVTLSLAACGGRHASVDEFRAEPSHVAAPSADAPTQFTLHSNISSNRRTACSLQTGGSFYGTLLKSRLGADCTGAHTVQCTSSMAPDGQGRYVECRASWPGGQTSTPLTLPTGTVGFGLLATAYDKSDWREGYNLGIILGAYDISEQDDSAVVEITLD